MIVIVDTGVSNVRSVGNMLRKAGVAADVTSDPARVAQADKLILPGVGAFDAGMRALSAHGLREALDHQVLEERVPVLGICLGMQLMARSSTEGREPGLGWLDAEVVRFEFGEGRATYKVPHMGWNTVTPNQPSPLLDGLDPEARFYFVHSYYLRCRHDEDVLGTTTYGHQFAAVVGRGNTFGVQFHPEKSHRFGMALLQRFAALT